MAESLRQLLNLPSQPLKASTAMIASLPQQLQQSVLLYLSENNFDKAKQMHDSWIKQAQQPVLALMNDPLSSTTKEVIIG